MTDYSFDDRATATTGHACGIPSIVRPDSQSGAVQDPAMTVLAGDSGDGGVVDVPTRMPDGVWAWLVTAVDLDPNDEPTLLEGVWVTEQPPASPLYDGDVVVRLTAHSSGTEGWSWWRCCCATPAAGLGWATGRTWARTGHGSSHRPPPP